MSGEGRINLDEVEIYEEKKFGRWGTIVLACGRDSIATASRISNAEK